MIISTKRTKTDFYCKRTSLSNKFTTRNLL